MKKHSFSIFALAISFCLALCACHTNYIDEPYPTDTDKEVSEDDILKTIGADFDPNGQHIDYTLAPNAHLIDEAATEGFITDEFLLPGVDQITINKDLYNKLGDIKEGEILVVMPSDNAPFGLLAKVESITPTDGSYILELSEAEYDDAFDTIDVELVVTAEQAALLDGFAYTDDSDAIQSQPLSRAKNNNKKGFKMPKTNIDLHDINNGIVQVNLDFKKQDKDSTSPWIFNGKGILRYEDKGSRIVITKKHNGTSRFDVTMAGYIDLSADFRVGVSKDNKPHEFKCPLFEKSTPKGKFPIYAGIGVYISGDFTGEVTTEFNLGCQMYFSQFFTFEDGEWTNPSFSEVTVSKYADDSSAGALKSNINGNYFNPHFKWKKLNLKGGFHIGFNGSVFGQWCKKITPKNRRQYYRRTKDGIAAAFERTSSIGLEASVDILDDNAFKESPRSHFVVDAESKIISRCNEEKHPYLSQLNTTLQKIRLYDWPSFAIFPTYESYSSRLNDSKTIAEFTWYSYIPYFLVSIVTDEKIELLEGDDKNVVATTKPSFVGFGDMPGDNFYTAEKKFVSFNNLDPKKKYAVRPIITYLGLTFYGNEYPLTGEQQHLLAAMGTALAIGYNEHGQPKKIIENPMERTTTYAYDNNNQLSQIQLKYWDEDAITMSNFVMSDHGNRFLSCRSYEPDEPGFATVKAVYDNSNRLQSFYDGVGMTQLVYWEDGNIVKIETFDENELQSSVTLVYDGKNEHINHHLQWTYLLSNELAPFTLAGLLGPTSMNLPVKAVITEEDETQTINISYDIDKETNYITEERFSIAGNTLRLPYAYRDMIVQSRSTNSYIEPIFSPKLFTKRNRAVTK